MAVGSLPLGAKRGASRDPINSWFPYYAGYSIEFAESVLKAAALPKGASVFDPWNGSGTTTLAAANLGLSGYGFDLNPIAVMIAKARLVNPDDAKGINGFVCEISACSHTNFSTKNDRLLEWFNPAIVNEFRKIQYEIIKNFATPKISSPLDLLDDHFPPIASFLLLALTRAAKSLVNCQPSSNPTVFRASGKTYKTRRMLIEAWHKKVIEMGHCLTLAGTSGKTPQICVGDSRDELLPANSIDFILTSPPYCTRLDYASTTNFELAALGPQSEEDFQKLRRNLMGAPLVRKAEKPMITNSWPKGVKDILTKVREHPSKASGSYYYKTYWQYFDDAIISLANIYNTLKPGGTAALVVQSSYYKNLIIDLPSLYCEIGDNIGFNSNISHDMPVRSVISSIHPGTKIYRKSWNYRESIVLLHKGGG